MHGTPYKGMNPYLSSAEARREHEKYHAASFGSLHFICFILWLRSISQTQSVLCTLLSKLWNHRSPPFITENSTVCMVGVTADFTSIGSSRMRVLCGSVLYQWHTIHGIWKCLKWSEICCMHGHITPAAHQLGCYGNKHMSIV